MSDENDTQSQSEQFVTALNDLQMQVISLRERVRKMEKLLQFTPEAEVSVPTWQNVEVDPPLTVVAVRDCDNTVYVRARNEDGGRDHFDWMEVNSGTRLNFFELKPYAPLGEV